MTDYRYRLGRGYNPSAGSRQLARRAPDIWPTREERRNDWRDILLVTILWAVVFVLIAAGIHA